jgi:hypothetical protein
VFLVATSGRERSLAEENAADSIADGRSVAGGADAGREMNDCAAAGDAADLKGDAADDVMAPKEDVAADDVADDVMAPKEDVGEDGAVDDEGLEEYVRRLMALARNQRDCGLIASDQESLTPALLPHQGLHQGAMEFPVCSERRRCLGFPVPRVLNALPAPNR